MRPPNGKPRRAALALEDGTLLFGRGSGAQGEAAGELVFNTSMAGYQEVLTDPSYKGQMVVMTYPQIGNYGITRGDMESRRPFLEGFIVRELSKTYSNWEAVESIQSSWRGTASWRSKAWTPGP